MYLKDGKLNVYVCEDIHAMLDTYIKNDRLFINDSYHGLYITSHKILAAWEEQLNMRRLKRRIAVEDIEVHVLEDCDIEELSDCVAVCKRTACVMVKLSDEELEFFQDLDLFAIVCSDEYLADIDGYLKDCEVFADVYEDVTSLYHKAAISLAGKLMMVQDHKNVVFYRTVGEHMAPIAEVGTIGFVEGSVNMRNIFEDYGGAIIDANELFFANNILYTSLSLEKAHYITQFVCNNRYNDGWLGTLIDQFKEDNFLACIDNKYGRNQQATNYICEIIRCIGIAITGRYDVVVPVVRRPMPLPSESFTGPDERFSITICPDICSATVFVKGLGRDSIIKYGTMVTSQGNKIILDMLSDICNCSKEDIKAVLGDWYNSFLNCTFIRVCSASSQGILTINPAMFTESNIIEGDNVIRLVRDGSYI